MTSTDLQLRSATPADEPALATLWQVCGLTTWYNDPGDDFRFAAGALHSDVLVATLADGAVVGSVMVGHDGHRGWMYYVAADPAYRALGIGRRMVEAAEAWLLALGVRKVLLMVRETNTGVMAFYDHLGYEPVPSRVMQKWLIPPTTPAES